MLIFRPIYNRDIFKYVNKKIFLFPVSRYLQDILPSLFYMRILEIFHLLVGTWIENEFKTMLRNTWNTYLNSDFPQMSSFPHLCIFLKFLYYHEETLFKGNQGYTLNLSKEWENKRNNDVSWFYEKTGEHIASVTCMCKKMQIYRKLKVPFH